MGSSVFNTVAALLPIRIRSLNTVRSTGLLESTGGEKNKNTQGKVVINYVCITVEKMK